MISNQKVIEGLQTIVTKLSQQADGHMIQSKIFASQGLVKLAEKYSEHATEERSYVERCIDRLLDLGFEIKLEAKEEEKVYTDAVEWVKHDLQVSKDGLVWLKTIVELAKEDYATFDMLKEYYKDEEEDMYWGEQQLELINVIGKQNWILKQM